SATTPLSLHDALPISQTCNTALSSGRLSKRAAKAAIAAARRKAELIFRLMPMLNRWPATENCMPPSPAPPIGCRKAEQSWTIARSEEHTSELQSRENL